MTIVNDRDALGRVVQSTALIRALVSVRSNGNEKEHVDNFYFGNAKWMRDADEFLGFLLDRLEGTSVLPVVSYFLKTTAVCQKCHSKREMDQV